MNNNNNKLRKLQLTELEILKKVDQVCRQYQTNYFLIAGTLLGAVRHRGFTNGVNRTHEN